MTIFSFFTYVPVLMIPPTLPHLPLPCRQPSSLDNEDSEFQMHRSNSDYSTALPELEWALAVTSSTQVLDKGQWITSCHHLADLRNWTLFWNRREAPLEDWEKEVNVQWERHGSQMVTQRETLCCPLGNALWGNGLTFRTPSSGYK